MTPVVAYSTTHHFDLEAEWSFARVLRADLKKRNKVVEDYLAGRLTLGNDPDGMPAISANHEKWELWSLESALFDERLPDVLLLDIQDVGPLLQSV